MPARLGTVGGNGLGQFAGGILEKTARYRTIRQAGIAFTIVFVIASPVLWLLFTGYRQDWVITSALAHARGIRITLPDKRTTYDLSNQSNPEMFTAFKRIRKVGSGAGTPLFDCDVAIDTGTDIVHASYSARQGLLYAMPFSAYRPIYSVGQPFYGWMRKRVPDEPPIANAETNTD